MILCSKRRQHPLPGHFLDSNGNKMVTQRMSQQQVSTLHEKSYGERQQHLKSFENAHHQQYTKARDNQDQSKYYFSASTLKEQQTMVKATLQHTEKYDIERVSSEKS